MIETIIINEYILSRASSLYPPVISMKYLDLYVQLIARRAAQEIIINLYILCNLDSNNFCFFFNFDDLNSCGNCLFFVLIFKHSISIYVQLNLLNEFYRLFVYL